jgi:L-alanine-DL-glutamate epimerase-like enolase superfamily enzyme
MAITRRDMLRGGAAALGGAVFSAAAGAAANAAGPTAAGGPARLGFADAPIAVHDFTRFVGQPLVLEALEIHWVNVNEHFLVGRFAGGLTAYLPTNKRFGDDLPLFTGRVLPFFLGRDLRFIEAHIEACQRANYKIVGLPFWNAVGHLDLLALEAIGQAAKRPVFDLVGGAKRREVAVYLSTRERTTTPEQEIDEFLLPRLERTGAKAVKLGVGGRMSRNADAWDGRSEALMARARKVLGDDVAIAVDANGSYDAATAIAVGRMLERYDGWFFEEPCPFEEFEMTAQVAAALDIAVAGGEQDASAPKWRWMIANRMVDIVQPDLFYAGGFLRSLRIASAAAAAGLDCIPHAPRAHAGAATMLHFIAAIERPGAFHEFSAKAALGDGAYDYAPRLTVRDGRIAVPDGPGFGLTYDVEGIVKRAKRYDYPRLEAGDDD